MLPIINGVTGRLPQNKFKSTGSPSKHMRDSKVNTTKNAVKAPPIVILNLTGGVTTLSQSISKPLETFSNEIFEH